MPKSLGWVRFDHYSIAVPDARQAIGFHRKLFGLEADHDFTYETAGFRGGVLDMPNSQGQIELISPAGDDSFLERFLQTHGPGLHHVALEVEDIEAAMTYLRDEMGIEPFGGLQSDGQWQHTFIHPRDSGGVLYQLFEWEPGHGPGQRVTDFDKGS